MNRLWRQRRLVASTISATLLILVAVLFLAAYPMRQQPTLEQITTELVPTATPDPLVIRRRELNRQLEDSAALAAWLAADIKRLAKERAELIAQVNAMETYRKLLEREAGVGP